MSSTQQTILATVSGLGLTVALPLLSVTFYTASVRGPIEVRSWQTLGRLFTEPLCTVLATVSTALMHGSVLLGLKAFHALPRFWMRTGRHMLESFVVVWVVSLVLFAFIVVARGS